MSSTRDNTSKPDSYGVLAQSDPAAPEWINIVVPGEFKKGETEEDVNDVSHCWSSENCYLRTTFLESQKAHLVSAPYHVRRP